MKHTLSLGLLLAAASWLFVQSGIRAADQTLTFSGSDPYHAIQSIRFQSAFDGATSGLYRPLTDGQAAYNYSVCLMYDTSLQKYRMYSGGRWRVTMPSGKYPAFGNTRVAADGDHVLQSQSTTGAGGTWSLSASRPMVSPVAANPKNQFPINH